VDEAGSRVRLMNSVVPPAAKAAELRQVQRQKDVLQVWTEPGNMIAKWGLSRDPRLLQAKRSGVPQ